MKTMKLIATTILIMLALAGNTFSQKSSDSLANELRPKILGKFSNLTFGLYIDTYYNATLDGNPDTSNIIPYSANCPIRDQIRMNVAALEFYYNAENVRSKLVLQYGDAPNLLSSPNAQFIKTLRQANFGFKVVKDLWVDFGYIFNPIGYESSWAVLNQVTPVTMGGYFEPGSVLGAKVSYKFSEKFDGGIMIGNPFSLAYSQNTNIGEIIFLNYRPLKNLGLTYNGMFGNKALKTASVRQHVMYNNFIVTYSPVKSLDLVGQFDFAAQGNSQISPDTNKTAVMYSGFLQAKYTFNKRISVAAKYEQLNDPHGFLTGVNVPTGRGLRTDGITVSAEFKPVSFGYIRMAYRVLEGYTGSKLFYSNTSDNIHLLIFSAGVRL